MNQSIISFHVIPGLMDALTLGCDVTTLWTTTTTTSLSSIELRASPWLHASNYRVIQRGKKCNGRKERDLLTRIRPHSLLCSESRISLTCQWSTLELADAFAVLMMAMRLGPWFSFTIRFPFHLLIFLWVWNFSFFTGINCIYHVDVSIFC